MPSMTTSLYDPAKHADLLASYCLDAGAGQCMYSPHFAPHQYETADFCQVEKRYGHIDHVCDLTAIPVEDGRFDLVLCSQVLD